MPPATDAYPELTNWLWLVLPIAGSLIPIYIAIVLFRYEKEGPLEWKADVRRSVAESIKAFGGFVLLAGLGYWLVMILFAFISVALTFTGLPKDYFEGPEGEKHGGRLLLAIAATWLLVAAIWSIRFLPRKRIE